MSIALLETTSTQTQLTVVAQQLKNSSVQVRSGNVGVGSGVIWHEDGLIVTNAHVAQTQKVAVELADGRIFQAVRTKIDPFLDLASLQIEATDLPAATIGDSNTLRVGELVLAVGNPVGAVGVLTAGIIQSLDLTNKANRAAITQSWVRADLRLAPGNSGGLLANASGQVIGINTMIAGGLALAVPSNLVESFLSGSRPYLGVTMQFVQVAKRRGFLLLNVEKDSLAQEAGLLAGDVLIGAFGQSFQRVDDLLNLLWHSEAGEVLRLEFLRAGKHHYGEVKLPGSKDFAGVKSP